MHGEDARGSRATYCMLMLIKHVYNIVIIYYHIYHDHNVYA